MVSWVEAGYGGVARRCGSGMPDRRPVGLASACPRAGCEETEATLTLVCVRRFDPPGTLLTDIGAEYKRAAFERGAL